MNKNIRRVFLIAIRFNDFLICLVKNKKLMKQLTIFLLIFVFNFIKIYKPQI